MTVKLFKENEGVNRKISEQKSVLNILTKNDCNNLSISKITSSDLDMDVETNTDRAYYVLSGQLIVGDSVANSGDVIYVKSDSKYNMKGTFEAVLINSPAFGVKK